MKNMPEIKGITMQSRKSKFMNFVNRDEIQVQELLSKDPRNHIQSIDPTGLKQKEKPKKKEAEKEVFVTKKGDDREDIGLFNRFNVDKEKFIRYPQKFQDDEIKKKLANELKPNQLKSQINQVDKAYTALLTANQMGIQVDYGDAYYVNEPVVARGVKDIDKKLKQNNEEDNPHAFKYKEKSHEILHIKQETIAERMAKGVHNILSKQGYMDISKQKKSKTTFISIQKNEIRRQEDMKRVFEEKERQKEEELKILAQKNRDVYNSNLLNSIPIKNTLQISSPMMNTSMKPPLAPIKENGVSLSQNARGLGMNAQGASSFARMKEGESGPNSTRENPLNGSQNSFINNSQSHHKKSHSAGASHSYLPDVNRPQNQQFYNAESASHYNTQSLAHIKASQVKISLKKPSIHTTVDPLDASENEIGYNQSSSKKKLPKVIRNHLYNTDEIKVEKEIEQHRAYDENVLLIKPGFDASDKEIYARNGYRTASKNLVNFLESGNRGKFIEDVFKPKYLGDFTNDNQGVIKAMKKGGVVRDFDLPFKEAMNERQGYSQSPQIVSNGKKMYDDQQGGKLDNYSGNHPKHRKNASSQQDYRTADPLIDDDEQPHPENMDPWATRTVILNNNPEHLKKQYLMDMKRQQMQGGNNRMMGMPDNYQQNQQQNDWDRVKQKRNMIKMRDPDKRMKKHLRKMDRLVDENTSEFRKLGMKVVQEEDSDDEEDVDYDSNDSDQVKKRELMKKIKQAKAKKQHDDEDDDGDQSQLSEYEDEKAKLVMLRNNMFADYGQVRRNIDESQLKEGEVLRNGMAIRPDRQDERQAFKKKKNINEEDMMYFKEKELLRQRLKNSNIIREVLKKQVKESQEKKFYKANDEIEAILLEKYKKEARQIKIFQEKDQGFYVRRQALIDKALLRNDKAMRSLAEKKRLWIGEEGQFSKKDLAKWYKVYNQTKLAEMKDIFDKKDDGYAMEGRYF